MPLVEPVTKAVLPVKKRSLMLSPIHYDDWSYSAPSY
jgi:hypothetical protein